MEKAATIFVLITLFHALTLGQELTSTSKKIELDSETYFVIPVEESISLTCTPPMGESLWTVKFTDASYTEKSAVSLASNASLRFGTMDLSSSANPSQLTIKDISSTNNLTVVTCNDATRTILLQGSPLVSGTPTGQVDSRTCDATISWKKAFSQLNVKYDVKVCLREKENVCVTSLPTEAVKTVFSGPGLPISDGNITENFTISVSAYLADKESIRADYDMGAFNTSECTNKAGRAAISREMMITIFGYLALMTVLLL